MSQSEPSQPTPEGDGGIHSQQVQMSHLSARVPDHVSRGVFSTGMIVITGATEFVLDFVQSVGKPHQVAARVVMPHSALPQFAEALRKNIELYRKRFGNPPNLPRTEQKPRPSIQDVYDDLKLPDEVMSGSYSNGVMISHSGSEFVLDFLTNFFPKSAVSARVFISASQVSRIQESLDGTVKQFQEKLRKQREASEREPSGEEKGDSHPSPPEDLPGPPPDDDQGGTH